MHKNPGPKRLIIFAIIFITLVLIDAFWIGFLASNFYQAELSGLALANFKIIPGLLVYFLLTMGFWKFVLASSKNAGDAVLKGGWFGITVYGIYDLTNYSTLKGWSLNLVLVDIAWGAVLCAVMCVFAYFLKEKVFKV